MNPKEILAILRSPHARFPSKQGRSGVTKKYPDQKKKTAQAKAKKKRRKQSYLSRKINRKIGKKRRK